MHARRDTVRLLGRSGSYTTDPARALRSGPVIEPEAVDRATQEHFTRAAHRAQAQAREVKRTEQAVMNGWARRIALCKAQAKHTGQDIRQPLRLLRLTMEGGRSDAAIEQRLRALERTCWPSLPTDD